MTEQNSCNDICIPAPLCLWIMFPRELNPVPCTYRLVETTGRLPFSFEYVVNRTGAGDMTWIMLDQQDGEVSRVVINRDFCGYLTPAKQSAPRIRLAQLPVAPGTEPTVVSGIRHVVHSLRPRRETWMDVNRCLFLRECIESSVGTLDWNVEDLEVGEPPIDFQSNPTR
jgi:hypothetical protein